MNKYHKSKEYFTLLLIQFDLKNNIKNCDPHLMCINKYNRVLYRVDGYNTRICCKKPRHRTNIFLLPD